MLNIGLTGGIASGKSSATHFFELLGIPVLDADILAKDALASGQPAFDWLYSRFGQSIMLANGTLDRTKIREYLFSDTDTKLKLEQIIHPQVKAQLQELMAVPTSAPYRILSIPLLLEAHFENLVDRILVIDADQQMQLDRLIQRDNQSIALAKSMMDAQVDRNTRLAAADDVIVNNKGMEDLEAAVKRQHQIYLEMTTRK